MADAAISTLHWGILPDPQKDLWPKPKTLPRHFVLYEGTALAPQLGHRKSVDFDFFGAQPFVPRQLYQQLPFLAHGRITQDDRDTLTTVVKTPG